MNLLVRVFSFITVVFLLVEAKSIIVDCFEDISTIKTGKDVDKIITKEFYRNSGYGGACYYKNRNRYLGGDRKNPEFFPTAFTRNFAVKTADSITFFLSFENTLDVTKIGLKKIITGDNQVNHINDAINEVRDVIKESINIYIPAGVYVLPDPIRPRDKTIIQGGGMHATIIKCKSDNAVLFASKESIGKKAEKRFQYLTLRDICFDGDNNCAYTGYISGYMYSKFENIVFRGATQYGCYVADVLNSSFSNIIVKFNQKTGLAIGKRINEWNWRQGDAFTVNFTPFNRIFIYKNGTHELYNREKDPLTICGLYIGSILGTVITDLYAERNVGPGLVVNNKNDPGPVLQNAYFESNDLKNESKGAWQFYISPNSDCAINNLYLLHRKNQIGFVDANAKLAINNWMSGISIYAKDVKTMNKIIFSGYALGGMFFKNNENSYLRKALLQSN